MARCMPRPVPRASQSHGASAPFCVGTGRCEVRDPYALCRAPRGFRGQRHRLGPLSRFLLSPVCADRVCRPGRAGASGVAVSGPLSLLHHTRLWALGASALARVRGGGQGSRCPRGQRTSGGWRGLCCRAPPRPPEALAVGGRAGPTSRVPGKQARGPRSSLPRRLLQPRRGEPGRPGCLASTLCRPL